MGAQPADDGGASSRNNTKETRAHAGLDVFRTPHSFDRSINGGVKLIDRSISRSSNHDARSGRNWAKRALAIWGQSEGEVDPVEAIDDPCAWGGGGGCSDPRTSPPCKC